MPGRRKYEVASASFERAAETVKEQQIREYRETNKPLFELVSPGLLVILDKISHVNHRRVKRLRADLRWAYFEAVRQGWITEGD